MATSSPTLTFAQDESSDDNLGGVYVVNPPPAAVLQRLERARALIELEDLEAVQILTSLRDEFKEAALDYTIDAGGGLQRSLAEHILWMISHLPESLLSVFRASADPLVRRAIEQDPDAAAGTLEQTLLDYWPSSIGDEGLKIVADRKFEEADFSGALFYYNKILEDFKTVSVNKVDIVCHAAYCRSRLGLPQTKDQLLSNLSDEERLSDATIGGFSGSLSEALDHIEVAASENQVIPAQVNARTAELSLETIIDIPRAAKLKTYLESCSGGFDEPAPPPKAVLSKHYAIVTSLDAVRCFDTNTGAMIWESLADFVSGTMDSPLPANIWRRGNLPATIVQDSSAGIDETIVAFTFDGALRVRKLESGDEILTIDANQFEEIYRNRCATIGPEDELKLTSISAPAYDSGYLYVIAAWTISDVRNVLIKIDAIDGSVAFARPIASGPSASYLGSYEIPHTPVIHSNQVICLPNSGLLTVLDNQSGRYEYCLRYQELTEGRRNAYSRIGISDFDSAMFVSDTIVIIRPSDSNRLVAIDRFKRAIIWSIVVGSKCSVAGIFGNRLIVWDDSIKTISLNDGRVLGHFESDLKNISAVSSVSDDCVVLCDGAGIQAFNLQTGSLGRAVNFGWINGNESSESCVFVSSGAGRSIVANEQRVIIATFGNESRVSPETPEEWKSAFIDNVSRKAFDTAWDTFEKGKSDTNPQVRNLFNSAAGRKLYFNARILEARGLANEHLFDAAAEALTRAESTLPEIEDSIACLIAQAMLQKKSGSPAFAQTIERILMEYATQKISIDVALKIARVPGYDYRMANLFGDIIFPAGVIAAAISTDGNRSFDRFRVRLSSVNYLEQYFRAVDPIMQDILGGKKLSPEVFADVLESIQMLGAAAYSPVATEIIRDGWQLFEFDSFDSSMRLAEISKKIAVDSARLGGVCHYAVYFDEPPVMDGHLNENWERRYVSDDSEFSSIRFVDRYEPVRPRSAVERPAVWDGPEDFGVEWYFGWDQEYFYTAAVVRDDFAVPFDFRESQMNLEGDVILSFIDKLVCGSSAFTNREGNMMLFGSQRQFPGQQGQDQRQEEEEDTTHRGLSRDEDRKITIYEQGLRWRSFFPDLQDDFIIPSGSVLTADGVVIDDDGLGMGAELYAGIGEGYYLNYYRFRDYLLPNRNLFAKIVLR
ncbi:MAG: PQQ-binding-like beta-propeller repeat protein [Planctomycetes bacterium]|nr:PQQ-binding-like beta-propeller repeat protein [Planctomycetota bacterium]